MDEECNLPPEVRPLHWFEMSVRTENILKFNNIHTLGTLATFTTREIMSWRNVGKFSLREMQRLLHENNLHFRDEMPVNEENVKIMINNIPSIISDMRNQVKDMTELLRTIDFKLQNFISDIDKNKIYYNREK